MPSASVQQPEAWLANVPGARSRRTMDVLLAQLVLWVNWVTTCVSRGSGIRSEIGQDRTDKSSVKQCLRFSCRSICSAVLLDRRSYEEDSRNRAESRRLRSFTF